MKKRLVNKKLLCGVAMLAVFSICITLAASVSKASEASIITRGQYRRETRTISDADYRLFVTIVYCEAGGEKYDSQLGVANVILNRVDSPDWPNSIKNVVYQKQQFSPVTNGYLNKCLNEYDQGKFNTKWHESCFKAVDDALAGKNNIGNRMYFMTPKALESTLGNNYYDKLVIGNTAFFNTNW